MCDENEHPAFREIEEKSITRSAGQCRQDRATGVTSMRAVSSLEASEAECFLGSDRHLTVTRIQSRFDRLCERQRPFLREASRRDSAGAKHRANCSSFRAGTLTDQTPQSGTAPVRDSIARHSCERVSSMYRELHVMTILSPSL
jgi:hypothetical protein